MNRRGRSYILPDRAGKELIKESWTAGKEDVGGPGSNTCTGVAVEFGTWTRLVAGRAVAESMPAAAPA